MKNSRYNISSFILLPILILTGLLTVISTAITSDDDRGPPTIEYSPDIYKVDIADADSLFIILEPSQASNGTLFKVTENGHVGEVKYYAEDGEEIPYQNILLLDLIDVNENYIMMSYTRTGTFVSQYKWLGCLVSKSDGSVFSLAEIGPPPGYLSTILKVDKEIYEDAEGNIYYKTFYDESSGEYKIIKLYLSEPEHITGEAYLPPNEYVFRFVVDKDSNCVYSTGGGIGRVKTRNGNLTDLENLVVSLWEGIDGNIYYADFSFIYKISINSSGNVSEEWYGYGGTHMPEITGDCHSVFNSTPFILKLNDRVIGANMGQGVLYKLDNPSSTPKCLYLQGLSFEQIRAAATSNNYYYIAGKNSASEPVLVKVNAADDSYVYLYDIGEFEVLSLSVQNEEVVFQGLRMADGVDVIAKIDQNNTISIIDVSLLTDTEIIIFLTKIR